MKKYLFVLVTLICLAPVIRASSPASSSKPQKLPEHEFSNEYWGSKNIDVTLHSTNGYTIHIKGKISYSIIPPGITGFTGTVQITGNGVNITINMEQTYNTDGYGSVEFTNDENGYAMSAVWSTTISLATNELNSSEIQSAFLAEVNYLVYGS